MIGVKTAKLADKEDNVHLNIDKCEQRQSTVEGNTHLNIDCDAPELSQTSTSHCQDSINTCESKSYDSNTEMLMRLAAALERGSSLG